VRPDIELCDVDGLAKRLDPLLVKPAAVVEPELDPKLIFPDPLF